MSRNLFAELKRRNVFRAAILYIGAVWALAQGISQLGPSVGAPEWATRWFLVASGIGFPFWIAFAWFFELTPEGLKLERDLAPGESVVRPSHRKLDFAIIGVLTVALVLLLTDRFVLHLGNTDAAAAAVEKSIAVLPFENLSDDKGNAYFANGMQDMILTKLATIGELKVIARRSTEKYGSHPDDLKAIAAQLRIATILEGSVQKSGNQVLISVRLVDAGSSRQLWADAYPRTLDNIFGVEGEVAQKVADALRASLTPAESASVAALPTRNAAALDLFLKAEEQAWLANSSWQDERFDAADGAYRQAIALDPDFALAIANRAYYRMDRHWLVKNLSDAELADVKAAIDRALALKPDLAQAHLALGYYLYWGFRRYDEATAELQQTLKLAPNNVLALEGLAFIERRTGRFTQTLEYLQEALRIAPRDSDVIGEYGDTLALVRRYAESDRQLALALQIDSNNVGAKVTLIFVRLFGLENLPGARDANRPPAAWTSSDSDAFSGDVINLANSRVYPDVVARDFDTAERELDAAPSDTPLQRLDRAAAHIAVRVIAGQRESVHAQCLEVAPQVQAALARLPDSLRLHNISAWIELCLGNDAAAIQAAQRSVELLPVEKDAYWGPNQLAGLAEVDAQAHAPDEALKLIERLLAMPAGMVMSVQRLKLDPVWDPLRKDPRFQELIGDRDAIRKAERPAASANQR